jgi:hypothetical protein
MNTDMKMKMKMKFFRPSAKSFFETSFMNHSSPKLFTSYTPQHSKK